MLVVSRWSGWAGWAGWPDFAARGLIVERSRFLHGIPVALQALLPVLAKFESLQSLVPDSSLLTSPAEFPDY